MQSRKNSITGEWFFSEQQLGWRKDAPMAILYNIFLQKIMIEALEEHEKNVKLCGRPIIANKRVADDAEGFAEK